MKAPRRLGDGNTEERVPETVMVMVVVVQMVMMISAMKTNSSLKFGVRTRFENELVSRV